MAGHFGRQVRRDRLAHGWSIAELARRAKLDAAHLSRVENGRRPPTARIAAALDGVFTEHRGWYLTWLEETRTAPEIPVTFRSWSDYEDRTAALRVWTPGIVDGLVQAQAYAAALIATSPGVSDDAAAARLNARMERRRRVLGRDKPPAVTLLVDEAALYRQVGTAEVMAAQRQISDAIYKHLKADAARAAASWRPGPGRATGERLCCQRGRLHPERQLFGQATPGPATTLRRPADQQKRASSRARKKTARTT